MKSGFAGQSIAHTNRFARAFSSVRMSVLVKQNGLVSMLIFEKIEKIKAITIQNDDIKI